MKTSPRILVASLALTFALVMLHASFVVEARTVAPSVDETATQAEQQANALQRGYRTGYSDGYQAGWSDSVARRRSDYRGKEDYQRADRVYIAAYGPLELYRDGYRQGFESGYDTGYARRGFNSTVPDTLARRGATTARNDEDANSNMTGDDTSSSSTSSSSNTPRHSTSSRNTTADDDYNNSTTSQTGATRRGAGAIPAGTTLRVELVNRLSSDISQRGDPFEARVVEPREYEGAIVSGRVTNVRRAGKARGTAELQLSFDQIRLNGGRFEDFNAQVVEVVRANGDTNVGSVDAEGGVRGKDSTKDDVAKVGASAGVGAIIGAIAGGGKGAAIGAILGGAVGTGGVMTQRGKDLRLERGQQLVIRTSR